MNIFTNILNFPLRAIRRYKGWRSDPLAVHGFKRLVQATQRYLGKPHYCPECGALVSHQRREELVNSESLEAFHYDFSFAETYMRGNVKFIWDEFYCPSCGRQIRVPEMKRYERRLRDGRGDKV